MAIGLAMETVGREAKGGTSTNKMDDLDKAVGSR